MSKPPVLILGLAGPVALLLLLGGCADRQPGGLHVKGSASVSLAGTTSGFTFPSDTRLVEDSTPHRDGLAGHCLLSRGGPGEPDLLDVGISRGAVPPLMGEGLQRIRVQIEPPGPARVTATMGDVEFSGVEGAACRVTRLYSNAADGVAGVQVDCDLSDAAGRTAHASADLDFAGCTGV